MRRKYRLLVMSITSLILILFGSFSFAWIVLINRTDSFIMTAANVQVDYHAYLNSIYIEPGPRLLYEGSTVVKSGIYHINVSDTNADDYITNLRVDIRVNSTVDTYIRVAIVDSLILSTIDYEGNRGEVAIVDKPINYAIDRYYMVNGVYYEDLIDAEIALGGITSNDEVIPGTKWFNNSLEDGYYYYSELIERDMSSTQLTIPFIEAFDGDEFDAKSVGYHLQFSIIVEAIQAGNNAPVYNWGLLTPPWGGSWA
ncbi:MAG: hypothetical protein RBT45_06255 [Acholeplasmataceae bacterium]|nr:hypothetical protein [Acholeplasmataceae bacterium]